MDKCLFSWPSSATDSLDWIESEVKSEGAVTIVGDSQFPLSSLVCPDSQDVGTRCVRRPDPVSSENSLKSRGIEVSLDMGCWDLADGEVKSQNSGSRPGRSPIVLCPPPSLDTQEFEVRYLRSDDVSPDISSLDQMACWDLADGEANLQDAVSPLDGAEIPPCPPPSLDSQEFLRRCKEQDGIISTNSEETPERLSPDALDICDLADGEARPSYPLKALDGENMSRFPPSPTIMQGLASRWEAKEIVSAVNSSTSLAFAQDESSTRSPCLNLSRSQIPRSAACSQNSQEIEINEVSKEDNVKENKSSAHCGSLGCGVDLQLLESRTSLAHVESIRPRAKCAAADQGGVHRSSPASLLDAPLTTPAPDTDGNVDGHRGKRKDEELSLSSTDKVLSRTSKHSPKSHRSVPKINSSVCRSPLRSLSVNPRFMNDVVDEDVSKGRLCHELEDLVPKAEGFKYMAHVAEAELLPSARQYITGKENMEGQKTQKEGMVDVSTTSKILVKIKPKFDAGNERDPKHPFQSSEKVRIHDIQPKSILQLDTNTLDRRSACSVQTRLSSRMGFTSLSTKTRKLESEDHEQAQGWLCPRDSKKLLSKKPKQRSIDTWLK